LEELLKSKNGAKIVTGYNTHERLCARQQGGTCVGIFDLLASYYSSTGHDPSGLGRWTSLLMVGKDDKKTRVVSAYIPCRSNKGGYSTVYAQHKRWLWSHKDRRCPRKAARDDLLRAIRGWRAAGEKVVLYCDHNESARRGHLARGLRKEGFYEGLATRHLELPEVKSWFRGRIQIGGVWFSNDIEIGACGLLPFGFGVGDHRGIFLLTYPSLLLLASAYLRYPARKHDVCRAGYQKCATNTTTGAPNR